MKVAILSLCKRQVDAPSVALGLTRVGNATLLQYQVKLAYNIGAKRILCHIDNVPGDLSQHETQAHAMGIEWTNFRNLADITQHISDEDEYILIADGFFCEEAFFNEFTDRTQHSILTVDADGVFEGFERLDINSLWGGLLKLSGGHLAQISDIPEDWSLESVLLRHAISSGVPANSLTETQIMDAGIINMSVKRVDLTRRLGMLNAPRNNWQPFDRLLGISAKKLAPKIWASRQAANILNTGLAISLSVALALSWLGLVALATVAYLIATIVLKIVDITDIPIPIRRNFIWQKVTFLACCSIGLSGMFLSQLPASGDFSAFSGPVYLVTIFISLQWSLLQTLYLAKPSQYKISTVIFDPLIQFLALFIGGIFDALPLVLIALIFCQLTLITVSNWLSANATLTKA